MKTLRHKISLPQVFPDLCQLLLLWWNSSGLLWGSGAEGRTASVPGSLSSLHLLRVVPGRWASPLRQGKYTISLCTHDLCTGLRLLQKQDVRMEELNQEKRREKPQGNVKVQNLFLSGSSSDRLSSFMWFYCSSNDACHISEALSSCANTVKPKTRVSGVLWFMF